MTTIFLHCPISRRQGGREAEQEERQRWVEKEQQRIMKSVKGEEIRDEAEVVLWIAQNSIHAVLYTQYSSIPGGFCTLFLDKRRVSTCVGLSNAPNVWACR